MRIVSLILILGLAIAGFSCSNPQKGSLSPDTRSAMDLLADNPIDVREKYFTLSEQIAQTLDEIAAVENDAQAILKLQEFMSDNDVALKRLQSQFDNWQKHETDEKVVAFIIKYNEQPSARTLRLLAPRLHKRFAYDPNYVLDVEALIHFISIRR